MWIAYLVDGDTSTIGVSFVQTGETEAEAIAKLRAQYIRAMESGGWGDGVPGWDDETDNPVSGTLLFAHRIED
jgi:hypothetical protein